MQTVRAAPVVDSDNSAALWCPILPVGWDTAPLRWWLASPKSARQRPAVTAKHAVAPAYPAARPAARADRAARRARAFAVKLTQSRAPVSSRASLRADVPDRGRASAGGAHAVQGSNGSSYAVPGRARCSCRHRRRSLHTPGGQAGDLGEIEVSLYRKAANGPLWIGRVHIALFTKHSAAREFGFEISLVR